MENIAISLLDHTTSCVGLASTLLQEKNYGVRLFPASGAGGLSMESLIADGLICGVLDFTTTELANDLVGGIARAGRDRLTAAGLKGVPQVIAPGALDFVTFGPPETVPERFRERRFFQQSPAVTLMRTTPQENDRLAKEIAEKASAARGPTAILLPLKGFSALDKEGEPFWWPEADLALFQSLRNWLSPHVRLVELDLHINDREFARTAVATLLEYLK